MIDSKVSEFIVCLSVVLSPLFYNKHRSFKTFWTINYLNKYFGKKSRQLLHLNKLNRFWFHINKRNNQRQNYFENKYFSIQLMITKFYELISVLISLNNLTVKLT